MIASEQMMTTGYPKSALQMCFRAKKGERFLPGPTKHHDLRLIINDRSFFIILVIPVMSDSDKYQIHRPRTK